MFCLFKTPSFLVHRPWKNICWKECNIPSSPLVNLLGLQYFEVKDDRMTLFRAEKREKERKKNGSQEDRKRRKKERKRMKKERKRI